MANDSTRRRTGAANTRRNTAYSTTTSSTDSAGQQPVQPTSTLNPSRTFGDSSEQSSRGGSSRYPSNPPSMSTTSGQSSLSSSEDGSVDSDRQHRRVRQPMYHYYALPGAADTTTEGGAQFGANTGPQQFNANAFQNEPVFAAAPPSGRQRSTREQLRSGQPDTNSYPTPPHPGAMSPQPQGQNEATPGLSSYNRGNAAVNGTYSPPDRERLARQQMRTGQPNTNAHPAPAYPYPVPQPHGQNGTVPSRSTYTGDNAGMYGIYSPPAAYTRQPQAPPPYRSPANQQIYEPPAGDPNIVNYYNASYRAGPSRNLRGGLGQG